MSNKFKVGDKVAWVAIPRTNGKREKPIKCVGVIQEIRKSTFGGSVHSTGARLVVTTRGYRARYGVNMTFVSLSKLSLV
jgi:hypothetical protein